MLRSLKELRGYQLTTQDGDVGKIHEFFFNDDIWAVVYLVVDIGGWFAGRRVLISPQAVGQPDYARQNIPVLLSREKIENSPDVATEKPVSRQKEIELHDYFNWPYYWTGLTIPGQYPQPPVPPIPKSKSKTEIEAEERMKEDFDPHLRSTREITKYRIAAIDGEIGHVEDLIADDEVWDLRYMVVDTRNWLPGKKVLISPAWISQITWSDSKVHIDLTREQIQKSPEYDPSQPINRDYENVLYDFYGRPKYWK
jgi:hypothetical protein